MVQISNKLGYSATAVRAALQELGLDTSRRNRTSLRINAWKKRFQESKKLPSLAAVARKYNTTETTVRLWFRACFENLSWNEYIKGNEI